MASSASVAWSRVAGITRFQWQQLRSSETRRSAGLRRKRFRALTRPNSAVKRKKRSGSDRVSRRVHDADVDENDNQECSRWLSYEELQHLSESLSFELLSPEDCARIEDEVKQNFGDDQLDRRICVISDVWIFRGDATCLCLRDLPFDALALVLSAKSWTTPAILQYYDCSCFDERHCGGMLISKRAFEKGKDGETLVWFSNSALKHLTEIQSIINEGVPRTAQFTAPRFSIAECFVAGMYEEISSATAIERQCIGMVQMRGIVKVIFGGPGNMLQSRMLAWDSRNANIVSQVPHVQTKENFHLVLAEPLTSEQEILLAKRHECNGDRVMKMHNVLHSINTLYGRMKVNGAFSGEANGAESNSARLPISPDTNDSISEAGARQSSVADGSITDTSDDVESVIVENEAILLETTADKTESERMNRAFENMTEKPICYLARRATALLQQNDPHYMERLFPHLFTFGIEDALFKLFMFDFLSLQRVKNSVFIRVGCDPQTAIDAARVSPEELETVMANWLQKRKATQTGKLLKPRQESSCANKLFKSVTASAAKMWGSNEERDVFKRKLDAMTIMYGSPSVFWTLTPNADQSITTAFIVCFVIQSFSLTILHCMGM